MPAPSDSPPIWRSLRRSPRALAVLALAAAILAGFVLRTEILGRRQDEVWERIQREKVLRVGLDPSFPPFEVDTGGEIVGYDVDLAHALAERWGARVQLVPTHFDGLVEGLLAGRYDVIISAFPYDPRLTQDVAYTQPYFNAGVVLVVRDDEQRVMGVDDLAGRRVAVEWGSAGDVEARRVARQVPSLELVPLETAEAALRAVAAGQADAALVDAVSAYGFIARQGSLRVVGGPLTDERYVIVVHPESWRLLEEIDAALEEFRGTGLLERLQSTWFAHR